MTDSSPDETPMGASGQQDWKALYEQLKEQVDNGTIAKAAVDAAIANGEVYSAKRFSNLSAKLNEVQKQRKELEAAVTELRGNLDALTSEKTELEESLSKLEQVATESQSTIERHKLIMSKFPHLAEFEADGLLPNSPLEELEEKLSVFSQRLEKVGEKKVVEAFKGSRPPDESAGEEVDEMQTPEDYLKAAMEALRNGDTEKYDTYYAQYISANTNEG